MSSSGGHWILQSVESNAIGAAVGAIVGATVSGLYKRAVRLEARRIELMLLALDHLLGGVAAETQNAQKGTMNPPTLAQYRKGIAAGFGVVLTGLLTWAETANLEPVLGPLVPESFRPLVGVLLGGIALTASVILTSNAPKMSPADSAVQSTIAERRASETSAAFTSPSLASLVAGVTANAGVGAGAGAVTSETSLVTLLPAPTKLYQ